MFSVFSCVYTEIKNYCEWVWIIKLVFDLYNVKGIKYPTV